MWLNISAAQGDLNSKKLRDEIQRLEAVDLAVADDPLARQSAIEAVSNTNKPRSTAGRGGTRAYRGKSKPKLN